MEKFNYKGVIKETLLTIEKIFDEDWSLKKVGLIVIIFAMPAGPLALVTYFTAKHIVNKKQKRE